MYERPFIKLVGKPIRVAFGCQAQVGKDTAVDYLQKISCDSEKISFAEPLYEIHDFAYRRCHFPYQKDRKLLQWLGTEWARNKDSEIWVRLAKEKIESINSNKSIFVSDLRFSNEMKMLKEKGFKIVRIIREYNTFQECNIPEKNHISENELTKIPLHLWDYVIYNDGTVDDLYFKLKQMAYKFQDEK